MLRVEKVINLYSDMNPQIDIMILLDYQSDEEKAVEILNQAFDDWFELDDNIEPIGDYIRSELKRHNIGCQLYFRG